MHFYEILLLISLLMMGISAVMFIISMFKSEFEVLPWSGVLAALGIIGLIVSICLYFSDTTIKYKYVDLDGNEGTAEYCTASDGLSCRIKGRSRIMVKSYNLIEED